MGDYVIAIDFGTAFSGYGYCITTAGSQSDPVLKRWGHEVGLNTPKTPTCILFDEHEEFIRFGYEAKSAYISAGQTKGRKLLFFENFKMTLYGKVLSRDMKIKAANGKTMKAQKVFSESLRFLKDDALKTIRINSAEREFLASDFTWVLTVPAIWDPSAKQFMREAATKAGIVSEGNEDKLLICLEPEAASVWCKKLPAEGFITQDHDNKTLDESPGTQYIVVDCGGGTIDITVHEVQEGGVLKELHKASGNDQGGQNVDRKFKELLREIFCDGVWDEYEAKYPGEVQRMMYEFTHLKRVDEDIQIVCSFSLGGIAQKKKDIEMFVEPVEGVTWNDGSVKISRDKLRSLFDESLCSITQSLENIFEKDLIIDYILLVGGYANSLILQKHIVDQFGKRCRVLCPLRAQEAILNGAVEFGRNPELVASRKSAYTYGFKITEVFDSSKHEKRKKFTVEGCDYCDNIFFKLVSVGQDVGWGEFKEYRFSPINSEQTLMRFTFYRAETDTVKYVDEKEAKEVASFAVEMPDIGKGKKRVVKFEVQLGSTEITAVATDLETYAQRFVKIDFMLGADEEVSGENYENT